MLVFAPTPTSGQVSDDLIHEPEEPPDDTLPELVHISEDKSGFSKQRPARIPVIRRESLLTRQLQPREAEAEQYTFGPVRRAISTSSVADLTSDNELTSPGTHGSPPSPPLPPIAGQLRIPTIEKHFAQEPVIAQSNVDEAEHKVETGLGRRRCITFACGKKTEPVKEVKEVVSKPATAETTPRKSMITFNCPSRTKTSPPKPLNLSSRHLSPAPPKMQKSPKSPRFPRQSSKNRRGSDMTITTVSPVATRKSPLPSPSKTTGITLVSRSKYAEDADEDKREANRFHEFAVNSRADEEWTEEATCHRQRLTIKDTLHKENVIRKMGEEVAEEEEDEDEDLDDDALLDELDEDDEDGDDDDEDIDEEDEDEDDDLSNTPHAGDGESVSDGGFDTDDEQGFANSSDEDGDDSDFEWWVPGRSTAATSTDHLETLRPIQRRSSDSSLESAREANVSTLNVKAYQRKKSKTAAVKINRAPTPELPDSTDFVCGTLDEDRPLEQAYKICIEQRKAAKHKITPQDIDPTFPTSDPEMDEEDEEDEVDNDEEDDQPLLMHGPIELDERGRRHAQNGNGKKKSKSPPLRLKSPAPMQRIHTRSPAPGPRRKSLRSPPPPVKAHRHRSPAPRKLFGQSPRRMRSPAPTGRPLSPPPSVEGTPKAGLRGRGMLASRPAPTRVTSLPRVTTATKLANMAAGLPVDEEDDDGNRLRVRGAIDIVKGLERKRQRRKEKLYQKHCQQKKKEGERKPKPGKGAERMRELGLELAAYRGKTAEHMLSI